ncbi:hypothetical protein HETIRDRAFT_62318 [Heterobasidion irregulare TC 32-1]|uniref:Hepatocellular carcinoma-associated antigen 59-domain-containing protein n=1 Tax=Heterobasidion irregulare (strain TC 32-1) TaxID=747525 RepID=W4KF37_HETIT|nr:uncharacterized protein HETIRDRAFT_62318 [Heterobasidion irregulare TC 32-1]ETW83676.1 hypothetical protein HETIRDRAFT_62318 [Heterobasidion irregulare TC 32-1]
MIRKRARPQHCARELSREVESLPADAEAGGDLRKLRKLRQGIDVAKLNKGDVKKRKKKRAREGEGKDGEGDDEDGEGEKDKEAKARRVVRANNFTQQTNALDVDKHMMAYIEENMKMRRGPQNAETETGPTDPSDDLYRLPDRYKVEKKAAEEGNVTNSLAMLTAIPEVDLGMDARLKNIEETEKAKLMLTQERKGRKKAGKTDEEHLSAARFYRPNMRMKSDADIIRDAKLEAMGLPPEEEHHRPHNQRSQMATDEMVMERFKKRMRK